MIKLSQILDFQGEAKFTYTNNPISQNSDVTLPASA